MTMLWVACFGAWAQGDPLAKPCVRVKTNAEAARWVRDMGRASRVIWVHRASGEFPPCPTGMQCYTGEPYWVVSAQDPRRRFWVEPTDVGGDWEYRGTRRVGFATLDEVRAEVRDGSGTAPETGTALRFAEQVWAVESRTIPVLAGSGTLAAVLLMAGLLGRGAGWGRACARMASGCPLALYLGGAPEWGPALTALCWLGAVWLPVRTTLLITACGVFVDQLGGLRWGDFSPLQGYFSSGIRFYGVGNEMLGIFLGALAVARPRSGRPWWALCGLLFFSNSALGADYGAVVAFAALLAWDWLPERGVLRRLPAGWPVWRLVVCVALGIGAALAAALLDAVFSDSPSHGGEAVRTAGRQGIAPLVDIVVRKLGMNAGLLLRPPTWAAIGAVAVLVGVVVRRLRQTGWRWRQAGYLLFTVFLGVAFNDSGLVTGLMALLPMLALTGETGKLPFGSNSETPAPRLT